MEHITETSMREEEARKETSITKWSEDGDHDPALPHFVKPNVFNVEDIIKKPNIAVQIKPVIT